MKSCILKFGMFFQKIMSKNLIIFIIIGFIKLLRIKFSISNDIEIFIEKYTLPIIISFSTGKEIEDKYGGNVAVIGSIFLILQGENNLFYIIIDAMIVAYSIKIIIDTIHKFSKSGLEMLFLNIFIPMLTLLFSHIVSFFLIEFSIYFKEIFSTVNAIKSNFIFILMITPIIEIGKIFFLNNLINHGILSLLGYSEIVEKGGSLYYLLETNPSSGFGVLLGSYIYYKSLRKNYSYLIIEFFGGIHEVYFSMVLKNLRLLFSLIIGSLIGNTLLYFYNVKLYSIPSPGSIITIFMFLHSGDRIYYFLIMILTICISTLITIFILNRFDKKQKEIIIEDFPKEKEIAFVCTGGFGTSVIGKNILLKRLKHYNIENVTVKNYYLGEKIEKTNKILTYSELKDKVSKIYLGREIEIIENYTDIEFYDNFIAKNFLKERDIGVIEINKRAKDFIFTKNQIVIYNKILWNYGNFKIEHYPYGVDIGDKKINLVIWGDERLRKKIERVTSKKKDYIFEKIELIDDKKELIEIFELDRE